MFTKLIFNIDGDVIELHLHEVVKLAIDIISDEPGTKPRILLEPNAVNQIIEKTQDETQKERFLSQRFKPYLLIPAHEEELNQLKHWLFIAKYYAEKKIRKTFMAGGLLFHHD